MPRTHENSSVFLEFESLQSFQKVERHYAFPCGDNGLTRLPVLIHLPETYDDFDVENFNASMSLDMNFSAGSRLQLDHEMQLTSRFRFCVNKQHLTKSGLELEKCYFSIFKCKII